MTTRPPIIVPAKPPRQYAPEVFLNRLILGAVVVAAPFLPLGIFDAPKQANDYIPDVARNTTIGLQNPLVPFIPAGFDQPRSVKQYIPDAVLNPVILTSGVVAAPFIPVQIDAQRTGKQYLPDQSYNPVVPNQGGIAYIITATGGTLRSNFTGDAGFDFTVGSKPLTVNALARWVVAGNSRTHTLKLTDAKSPDPNVLASVVLNTSGLAVGFNYVSLTTPVVLNSGGKYACWTTETSGLDQFLDHNSTTTQTTDATIVSSVYNNDGHVIHEDFAGKVYGPVNFLYSIGLNAPFVPVVLTEQKTVRNILLDVLVNPVLPAAATAVQAPFNGQTLDPLPIRRQFAPETLNNPLLPGSGSAVVAPFIPVQIDAPQSRKQFIHYGLTNPVALAAGAAAPFVAPQSDQPRLPRQYVPDASVNITLALNNSLLPLLIPDVIDIWPRPARQFVPDVLFNPIALGAGTAAPFTPASFYPPRSARQYAPDILFNPVALSPVAASAPFLPAALDAPPLRRQYVPDVLNNPVIPLQSGVPFVPSIFEAQKTTRQYVPDVVSNTTALFPAAAAAPFIPPAVDQPRTGRQYAPDTLFNPVILSAVAPPPSPFVPVLPDTAKSARQYLADAVFNPIVPAQAAVPFTPVLFEASKLRPQYVPDVLDNPFPPLVAGAQAAPFVPIHFVPPRGTRQTTSEVFANPVLPPAAAIAAPFIPNALDTQVKAARQFVPDVVGNSLLPPATAVAAPFAPAPFDPPKPPRPSRMDAGTNPVIPLQAGVPFTPALFDTPKTGRQFVPAVSRSWLAISTSAATPFVPSFFDPPVRARQVIADAVFNPVVPSRQAPFITVSFDAGKTVKTGLLGGQYVPGLPFNPILPGPIYGRLESFVYSRMISIYREQTEIASGNVGYMQHSRTTEVLILSNIPASLQSPSIGARRTGDGILPDDAAGPIRWNIFVAAGLIPKGTVVSRDIVVDDEGNRYQVASAYWTLLGWKIQTIRLEA